ncbi:MAG: hypothetical protein Q4F69_11585 [Bacteroidia bacterium]|nr:hypothetical protein [Bacteroidia bacterium]
MESTIYKVRYDAPEMKTTEFRTELGYAVSEEPGSSVSAKITLQGGSL